MTQFAKINREDLLFVVQNMRQRDRSEVFATRWDDSSESLTDDLIAGGEFAWIAGVPGKPIAAFGAAPVWNGVWAVWMVATDDWPEVALEVTRFIKRVMIQTLKDIGAHRAECRSWEGHPQAHRWLEMLGAKKESEIENFGRNGERFYLYCWTKEVTKPYSA
jgi:hypothetical protein